MAQPIITSDVLSLIKSVCDIPASPKDSDNTLRWKAAQRDVYLTLRNIHQGQQHGTSKASSLGFKIRKDE